MTEGEQTATRAAESEWHRPENWYGGWFGVYFAPRDPCVWVPKRRPGRGWTLNFARGASYAYLALMLFPAAATVAAVIWFGAGRGP
jgi:uncharacterized membrane protein